MPTAQIRCIRKRPSHYDAHQRITDVGGINEDGSSWRITEEKAISMIRQQGWSFWVSVNGRRVDVVIASHAGRSYLKTVADDYAPNNLLALPECP